MIIMPNPIIHKRVDELLPGEVGVYEDTSGRKIFMGGLISISENETKPGIIALHQNPPKVFEPVDRSLLVEVLPPGSKITFTIPELREETR